MTTTKTATPITPNLPKQLRVRAAKPKSGIGPKLKPKWHPAQTCLGRDLPQGWVQIPPPPDVQFVDGGRMFMSGGGLQIIESVGTEQDGKRWQHVSVLRQEGDRAVLPTWMDLVMVKRLFAGHDSTMLQVLPPSSKHVSIHDQVLHLFRCLDGEVTPDFTRGKWQI